MPLRDRQPQDVSERARVPVGDGARKPGDLGGEHRLGRHDPLQEASRPMVAGARPVQHETVGQLPGETHPHSRTRAGLRREPFRHQVIEWPIQVGERMSTAIRATGLSRGGQPLRALRLPRGLGGLLGLAAPVRPAALAARVVFGGRASGWGVPAPSFRVSPPPRPTRCPPLARTPREARAGGDPAPRELKAARNRTTLLPAGPDGGSEPGQPMCRYRREKGTEPFRAHMPETGPASGNDIPDK